MRAGCEVRRGQTRSPHERSNSPPAIPGYQGLPSSIRAAAGLFSVNLGGIEHPLGVTEFQRQGSVGCIAHDGAVEA